MKWKEIPHNTNIYYSLYHLIIQCDNVLLSRSLLVVTGLNSLGAVHCYPLLASINFTVLLSRGVNTVSVGSADSEPPPPDSLLG